MWDDVGTLAFNVMPGCGSGCLEQTSETAVPVLRLFLIGGFRLETVSGVDLTPRSAKACGLIALLAVSPQGRRARIWLQDKLWSDRGRDQGSASLRQALSQIRRDLAVYADVLVATRNSIRLDLDRVTVADPKVGTSGREFLEGIDIRDPEFEAWLRQERVARADTESARGPPVTRPVAVSPGLASVFRTRSVYLLPMTVAASPERLFEDLFIDCLERSIRETLVADVFRRAPDPGVPDPIIVSVQAFVAGNSDVGMRLAIEEGPRRRALWSGKRVVPARGAPPVESVDILALVHEATEALADGLLTRAARGREALDAAILGRLAVRKIFSMNPAEVAEADALLVQAFDRDPRAVFLAWRVQLRVIQRMERHLTVSSTDDFEIQGLIAQALQLEPGNSMVLATAANALVLIDDDIPSGLDLAQRALSLNAANPFAWDCLSIGLLMNGRAEEAHDYQLRACALSSRSPIRHFWNMGACLTSVVTGRLDSALQLAHSASVLVPEFRPPLRYMAALHAASGDTDRAMQSVGRLQRLEGDFSVARMIEDRSYPIAALRRSGLLENAALRDLRG